MRITTTAFLSFAFFLVVISNVKAQNNTASSGGISLNNTLQTLGVGDGSLPQGYVNGIVQDSTGFIWLSTLDGLSRYDGYQVKNFRYDATNPFTIASNVIKTIYIDKENQIWILYVNGLVDIFDPETENVKHVNDQNPLGWLTKGVVRQPFTLMGDSRKGYWIVSSDLKKLSFFTMKNPREVIIPVPDGEKIIAIKESSHGDIFVSTDRSFYNIKQNRFHKIADLPQITLYSGKNISQMVQDNKGNWIIRDEDALKIFKTNGQWQVIKTPQYTPTKPVTFFLSLANDGNVYFNADGSIFRLNPDYSLSLLFSNPNRPAHFISMMIDRGNVLWTGTNTFGAIYTSLVSNGFQSYSYKNGFVMDVLAHSFQISFSRPSENDFDSYVVRYVYGPLKKLWVLNGPISATTSREEKKKLSLYQVSNQKYIPYYFDYKASKWLQMVFDSQNICWGILQKDDQFHIQLVKADLDKRTILPVMRLPPFYEVPNYLSTFQNKLCIVYNKAIQIFDPATNQSVFYDSKDIFGNVALLTATPDPKDSAILWITSMGNGLMQFDTRSGKVKAYTESAGFPSNTVYAAIPDNKGFLWCSSNRGIFRFNPENKNFISFTAKDGLQGNEFNRYHFLTTPDNHIIFGGTNGWTSIYPDSVRTNEYQPNTVITNILIKNSPLNSLKGWKDSVVSNLHTLKLNYNQDYITITFAGLEFRNSNKLQYRYKLEGLNKDWIDIGTQHIANYTNLKPGKYIFKVNSGNESGKWSNQISKLRIIISPPWWKTGWAYILFFIVSGILVYLLYRAYIHRINTNHEIILQRKEAEQLKEMDKMKSRFFTNIAHEFRTPLSLILAPLEEINKEKAATPLIKKKMRLVQRNANQLLRLINQLLDISKMEAGNMKVSLSRGDLGLFIEDIIRNIEGKAAAKNIQLLYNNQLSDIFNFDSDKWQKISANLLSNAIKFTKDGGIIKVDLRADSHEGNTQLVTMQVKDSGIGIPEKQLPHIFDRFYQVDDSHTKAHGGTGIGLALVKEITELMGGTISAESKPGEGSLFRVSIPVEKMAGESAPESDKFITESLQKETDESGHEQKIPNENVSLILVVEDNKELNHFIGHSLIGNYRILSAFNGKEALEMTIRDLPDLIISDIMMPEMDGYEMCRLIKQSPVTNHIAVLLLSAKSSHDSVIEGLENYADSYVTKPFHVDELNLRVHNLLDRQQKLKVYYTNQLTNPKEKIDTSTISNPFLSKLYQIINENMDEENLNVEILSEKMFMNRRTLNRKLKMMINLSPHDVISQYRLKKAGELLKSGCNVSETAYKVGFKSPSYFSVSFKEFYGVTPSEYEG